MVIVIGVSLASPTSTRHVIGIHVSPAYQEWSRDCVWKKCVYSTLGDSATMWHLYIATLISSVTFRSKLLPASSIAKFPWLGSSVSCDRRTCGGKGRPLPHEMVWFGTWSEHWSSFFVWAFEPAMLRNYCGRSLGGNISGNNHLLWHVYQHVCGSFRSMYVSRSKVYYLQYFR